jgi:hypothetical protein
VDAGRNDVTDRKPLLLVLDFPGRRAEARVSDMRLEMAGCDVRYLLAAPFPRETTAKAYAAELLARQGTTITEVGAVAAYCMAAPIAQELAALLGGGYPVPLMLFDGEPATPATILEQYRESLSQVRGRTEGRGPEPMDVAELTSRPAACVDRIGSRLVAAALPKFLGDGDLDEVDATEAAGELVEFYLDWLVHLVAAHNAAWPPWSGEVLHVVSRGHTYTGDWPGAGTTRVRRVDSARSDLLRHPGTREIALSFLGLERDELHQQGPADDER